MEEAEVNAELNSIKMKHGSIFFGTNSWRSHTSRVSVELGRAVQGAVSDLVSD